MNTHNENIIDTLIQVRKEHSLPFSIEVLNLSPKVFRALLRNGMATIGDVVENWDKVSDFKNLGNTGILEIHEKLNLWRQQKEDLSLSTATAQSRSNNDNLIKIKVRELNLSSRDNLLLWNCDIHTIDQITSAKLGQISSAKGTDPRTVTRIYTAILDWSNEDENRKRVYFEVMKGEGLIARPEEIGINNYLNTLFTLLNPRYFSIIDFRFGLRTGGKATLGEAAKHFGVTPERIRQIESQAIETISKRMTQTGQSAWFSTIKEKIDARGGLISESRLIDELQRVSMDTTYSMARIMGFFNKVFNGEMRLIQDDVKIIYLQTLSGWFTSNNDKDQILHAADLILKILSTTNLPLQWPDLFSALHREHGSFTLSENLAHAITLCLSDTQQIQCQMDGGWVIYEKPTRITRIKSVMKEIGHPVHFSEIAVKYNRAYPDFPMSELNLHNAIAFHEEFVRVGQGKYGLPEWGLHDDGNVSNAVRRILMDQKTPMYLRDITNEVLKTWDVQRSAVVSAIENDARFYKTEDGKVWLTSIGLTIEKRKKREDGSRVDRLLLIIKEQGIPTSIQTIVETHNLSFPERPITILAAKRLLYGNPKLFISMGFKEFGLAEWGLKPTLPGVMDT